MVLMPKITYIYLYWRFSNLFYYMTHSDDKNNSVIEIMKNKSMHTYKPYFKYILIFNIESSKNNTIHIRLESFRDNFAFLNYVNYVYLIIYIQISFICTCIFFTGVE